MIVDTDIKWVSRKGIGYSTNNSMSVVAYRIPMYFIIFMARLHEHILRFGQT